MPFQSRIHEEVEQKDRTKIIQTVSRLFSRGSSALIGIAYQLVRYSLRLLPSPIAVSIGRNLGSLVSYLCSREMAIAREQLLFAFPGLNKNAEAKSLAQGCFQHMGESVAEMLILDRILHSEHVEILDDHLIRSAGKCDTAAIVLSGHLGCFELIAAHYASTGLSISVVGRDANYPSLAVAHRQFRETFGVETIWREDPAAGFQLLRAIKSKRIIAALLDHDTKLENEFCPFFGVDAASPAALLHLAIRYRLPVLTSFVVREQPLKHKLVNRKIEYKPEDPSAIYFILGEYNRQLEDLIRKYPSQWIWWHRRWRRRPKIDYQQDPEKLRSTEEYINWLQEINQRQTKTSGGAY